MPGSEDSEMLDTGDSGSKGDIIARAKGETHTPLDLYLTPWTYTY